MRSTTHPSVTPGPATLTSWGVLMAISLCHMINDVMQSMLAAIYPLLQVEFDLSYAQIGVMTLAFQVTASLLQPLIGTTARIGTRSAAVAVFDIKFESM